MKSYAKRVVSEEQPQASHEADWPFTVPSAVYHGEHYGLVGDILTRSRIVVAYVPEDDDHLIGYICFEAQPDAVVLHYLYVKETFRRLGIGSKLYDWPVTLSDGQMMFASHWCWRFAKSVMRDTKVVFNPYRGFGNGKART